MKIHKNVFKFSLRKSAKFPVGEIQIIFRSKMRQFKNLKKREEKIKEKINKQNRKKTEKNSRKKKIYFWRENSIQTKQKKKTEKKQKNTTEKTKLQKTRKKIYFWRENSNSFLVIYYQYFYPNQLL